MTSTHPPLHDAFEAYLHATAVHAIEKHAAEQAAKGLEALGLLLGTAAQWRGHPYIVVDEYITAPNEASAVRVRFAPQAFAQLAQSLHERKSKLIVGWSHTHPGYGCFLSATDVHTQRSYFDEPYHIALVTDPLKSNPRGFERRAFKLDENLSGYREASYAVIEKK